MAKSAKKQSKAQKGQKGRHNWHIVARTEFLFRAMNFLSSLPKADQPDQVDSSLIETDRMIDLEPDNQISPLPTNSDDPPPAIEANIPLTSHLGIHLRTVAQKAQIRLPQSIKRSICKRCNSLLTPNTASVRIDNPSKKNKKQADVLVFQCDVCGVGKKFPVGNDLQKTRRKGRQDGYKNQKDGRRIANTAVRPT